MAQKCKVKPSKKDLKLALNDVLKRYGIEPSGQPQATHGARRPEPMTSGSAAARKRSSQAELAELCPPLEFGWYRYREPAIGDIPLQKKPADKFQRDLNPAELPKGEIVEYIRFHYLIRIVECTLTLHCEVRATSALEARSHLERIPNLIEWRELCAHELAEIVSMQ